MKSRVLLGTGVIVFALIVIVIDAVDLRGQRNPNFNDDVNPAFPLQKDNRKGVSSTQPAAGSPAGKTTVPQQRSIFPNRTAGSSNLRYDPTRNAPQSPKTNHGRVSSSTEGVTTADAQSTSGRSTVVQAGHHQEPNRGLNRDGFEVPVRNNLPEPPSISVSPGTRMSPPGVRGSILGLQGESAIELSIRLKQDVQELERQNEDLRQANSNLQIRFDESQNHLLSVVREIQSARRDLETARTDLDRLRGELQNLHEKIRVAQKEHTDLLQSMGPLLQQMLEVDEVSSLPSNPME